MLSTRKFPGSMYSFPLRLQEFKTQNAFTSLVNKFTSSFVRLLICFSEECLFFFSLNETSFSFHCNLRACIFFFSLFVGSLIEHNAGQTSPLPWPAHCPNMALPLKRLEVVQHCALPFWGPNIIGGKWTMSWSLYACVCRRAPRRPGQGVLLFNLYAKRGNALTRLAAFHCNARCDKWKVLNENAALRREALGWVFWQWSARNAIGAKRALKVTAKVFFFYHRKHLLPSVKSVSVPGRKVIWERSGGECCRVLRFH